MAIEKKDAVFAFAKHMVSVKYEDIPPGAIESTKMSILGTLGPAIAASTTVPVCKQMMELAKEMGGKQESTIIAYGVKVPCYMASFVNAALAHGLNFGDVCEEYLSHPGVVIFPAALAMAERVGKVSGKEFITAFTLALDIIVRLGRSLVLKEAPRDWIRYGWLPPQILGYFSAAAVAGRLLGLDEHQMVKAFGLAYSQTAGITEEVAGVGVDKAIYPSYAGLAGVLSALMAQKSITGPTHSLEGKNGLFNVYFQGEYDSSSLIRDLGKTFEGVNIGFFSFPCCAHTHAYIETALQMVDENKFRPENVETVTLFVGSLEKEALGLCDPLEVRRNPTNTSEAQLSLPYTVATAMTQGKPRIKHFVGGGFKDPEILRLSNKVVCQADSEYGQKVGRGMTRPAIEIKLTDGRMLHSDRKVFRYGHPQNPMSKEEHIEKFSDCVSYSVKPLPKDSLEELIKMLTKLEEVDDVTEIIRLVS